MTDITKCSGINCTERNFCYRYKAGIDYFYQSWADFYTYIVDGKCPHKLPIK